MTVAFVPGLLLAAILVVGWSRAALLRLAGAAVVAFAVAGPWWIDQWSESIYPYLFRYGYGQGADELGPSSPVLRGLVRLGLLMTDVRLLMIVPAVIVAVAGAIAAWRAVAARGWRPVLGDHRELAAVWAVVGVGWLALLSSSNMGTFFQLPLEVVAIAGLASLPVRGRWVVPVATWCCVVALVNVLLIGNLRIGSTRKVGGVSLSIVAFGGPEVGQSIDFENGDRRFAPAAEPSASRAAMAEWANAHDQTAAAVDELTPPGASDQVVQTFLGDIRLYQATMLQLAAELTDRGRSPWEAPTATSTIGDGAVDLSPLDASGRHRILVAVRARSYTEQEGIPADDTLARAAAAGWSAARTVPLPDGGVVELWTHVDNAEFHGGDGG